MNTKVNASSAPLPPRVRLCLGLTGHREDNLAFAANRNAIETQLARILDVIDATVNDERSLRGADSTAPTRLHCLLADGADQMACSLALARNWQLVAPLPFGQALNAAINAHAQTVADAHGVLNGELEKCSGTVGERATRIHALAARSCVFELAERDDFIAGLFLDKLAHPDDARKAAAFSAESSLRAALAARVMIEQSDLLIGIWDGVSRAYIGGTGHTIQIALETGAPVLWINASAPEKWRLLSGPEELASIQAQEQQTVEGYASSLTSEQQRVAELQDRIRRALRPALTPKHAHHKKHKKPAGPETLSKEKLPQRSSLVWHLYRRVEALFGSDSFAARFRSLRQTYETPEKICTGSAAPLLAKTRSLPGQHDAFVSKVESEILRRFAWADGVSARLSDLYRGGMTANFLLAPFAIVGGIAYLPFASSDEKWMFALFELALLGSIVCITVIGQRQRWHGRWFETRRVAEYLRHAPILLTLGVARPPGRWPQGTETSWPEWYARHVVREVGLPQLAITQTYLRDAVRDLLHPHVVGQRDYHIGKTRRLAAVHHNLDRLSEVLFSLALVAVTAYLVLKGGSLLDWWHHMPEHVSYFFTFLGVLLPTFGGGIAGIRYFGDFERFSAISSVTAEKLQGVHTRIEQLLNTSASALDYSHISDLAQATDDVVVSEIENWQAVFGGKQVTVPV